MPVPVDSLSRRERVRQATVQEIKKLALAQVASEGPGALSLRAVARDMGMTSSALYRYFASREQLLAELIVDSFASLADALEHVEAECNGPVGAAERWMAVARAHRTWALDHPTEYVLAFATPWPGVLEGDHKSEEMKRGVDVLFRAMQAGFASGDFKVSTAAAAVSPALRARIDEWQHGDPGCPVPPTDLPVEAVAMCLVAWAELHGAISLELSGRLPPQLRPADELFDHQMRQVISGMSRGAGTT